MSRALLALVALLLVSAGQAAEVWNGKVVAITDGDTVKVLRDGRDQVKIRIAEIDTPERRQPRGVLALSGHWPRWSTAGLSRSIP